MIDPWNYKSGDCFYYLTPNGYISTVQYKGAYQYSESLGLSVLCKQDIKQTLTDYLACYFDAHKLYATREEAQAAWFNGRRQKYR